LVRVFGGNGNDRIDLYSHAFVDGGPGNDTVNFNANISASILGGDDDDIFVGNGHAISGSINGGNGNDSFIDIASPGLGRLTLTGGPGSDIFMGTTGELNGVVIADFGAGDMLRFTNVIADAFQFSLSGTTLTYNGGSLAFGAPLAGTLVLHNLGGRTILTLSPGPLPHDANSDFNGDGHSDILWRNNSGTLTDWLATALGGYTPNAANALTSVATDWQVAGLGDFNGDGRDDILWRNDDGRISDWLGTLTGGFVDNAAVAYDAVATSWHVADVGDFNGDGRDDILWRNDSGSLTDWLGTISGGFTPNAANALAVVATDWQVVGTGDFDGDGRDDILWRNDDGRITSWLGTATGGFTDNIANAYNGVSADWHVVGIGDFDGDRRDDILWRNDDGRISDWLGTASGGFAPNAANALFMVALDWQVAAVGDYNGDGRDDILFRNDDGRLTNWLGTSTGGFSDNVANGYVATDNQWQIQPNPSGLGTWDY
jgi:hypothetical protein